MSPPPRTRTSRTRATTSGGCCTRRGSRRGSTTRVSSSSCSSWGSVSPTPPLARRRGRVTYASATLPARLSGWSGSRSSSTRARSASSARRRTAARSASGPSSGCKSAASARRRSSCFPRLRRPTRLCPGPSACAGFRPSSTPSRRKAPARPPSRGCSPETRRSRRGCAPTHDARAPLAIPGPPGRSGLPPRCRRPCR